MTNSYETIALVALILSVVSLIVSLSSSVMWVAQKLSTHRIEWRTLGSEDVQDAKTIAAKLNEPLEEEEFDSI